MSTQSQDAFEITVDRPTRTAIVEELVCDVRGDLGEDLGRALEDGSCHESKRTLRRLKMIVKMLDRLDGWGPNHNQPAKFAEGKRAATRQQYNVRADSEFFLWLSDRLSVTEGLYFHDLAGSNGKVDPEAYDNFGLLGQLQARLRAGMEERLSLSAGKCNADDEDRNPAMRVALDRATRDEIIGEVISDNSSKEYGIESFERRDADSLRYEAAQLVTFARVLDSLGTEDVGDRESYTLEVCDMLRGWLERMVDYYETEVSIRDGAVRHAALKTVLDLAQGVVA